MKAVIIGCGQIAGGYDLKKQEPDQILTHAQAMRDLKIELTAVYDNDLSRAKAFAENWGAQEILKSLNDIPSVDIVAICSATDSHYSVFKEVVRAKPKLILCEKPIASTLEHAREMVKIAGSTPVAVNYIRRWDAEIQKIIRESAAWGKLVGGRITYTKGVLHTASHALNLLEAFQVIPKKFKPIHVFEKNEADFLASFHLETATQNFIFEAVSGLEFNPFEIDLWFQKARVRMPGGGATIEIYPPQSSGIYAPQPEIRKGSLKFALKDVYQNLMDHLQTGVALKCDGASGLQTLQWCQELRSSL